MSTAKKVAMEHLRSILTTAQRDDMDGVRLLGMIEREAKAALVAVWGAAK